MSPDKAQARKMVLVSAFLLAGIAVYKDRQSPGEMFKRLWGVGVVGLVLSLAADFAPTVAGPFAVLVVLGSLGKDPNLIDKALGKVTGGTASSAAETAASPGRSTK